jgi:peroxiredoxin
MTLEEKLAEYKAQFARTAPDGRVALYESKIADMRRLFPVDRAVRQGDAAPDFSLPDALGRPFSLAAALGKGPVVLTFYRGGWCPYCNLQLRAYQQALPAIHRLGGQLVAISPQCPDASLSTTEKNELQYPVLSDAGNAVARIYGLAYSLPQELRTVLSANGKALPGINGDDSWELPITATYVIARDGRVALAFLDVDYRQRLDPADIVRALEAIG